MNSSKHIRLITYLLAGVSFMAILMTFYNLTVLTKGAEVFGTDTFMRLVRVEELHESFNWFDSVIERSNAPLGDELHWTRALDIVLLIPAMIVSLFVPFSKALYLVGIVLSPIIGCIVLYLLIWMSRPILKVKNIYFIYLLFLTQLIFFEVFNFGRPDHHSLLLLLYVLIIGNMIRITREKSNFKRLLVIGIILSLSIWISVEAIVLVGIVLATLSLLWIVYKDDYLDKALIISLILTISSTVLLLIERPLSKVMVVEYDKISITYIVFFLICTIILYLTKIIYKNISVGNIIKRISLISIIGIVGAIVMLTIFPDFIKGPFADVNPEIVGIWLDKVSEVQPILNGDLTGWGKLLIYMGVPIISFIYINTRLFIKTETEKKTLIFIIITMGAYGVLSLMQIRWTSYFQMISLIPSVLLLDKLLVVVNEFKVKKLLPILRIVTISAYLFLFTGIGISMVLVGDQNEYVPLDLDEIEELSYWINDNLDNNGTILTFLDFGPEILYYTDNRVISTPYHRNDEGMLFNYNVMTSTDDDYVYKELESRYVDWILIAPNSMEKVFYESDLIEESFYNGLINEQLPKWIEEVVLPEKHNEFRLFSFAKEKLNK